MKILFTGGGTMGPVTPLLAVAEAWKKQNPNIQFHWIGTEYGPEREVIKNKGISFDDIATARFTRYPSFEWLMLPINLLRAFLETRTILQREKPDLIASAGGFTGVPVVIVGFFMGIRSWIHQQDAQALLANKIAVPFAKTITVAWKDSLKDFPKRKTHLIGNPVRPSILEGRKEKAIEKFNLKSELPTILISGGGSGSKWINDLLERIGPELSQKANIIHITGKQKMTVDLQEIGENYHAIEFAEEEMGDVLAASTIVLGRAGMGTITELSALQKAAIFIPLPDSAQEKNAKILEDAGAAIIRPQRTSTPQEIYEIIVDLLQDHQKQETLAWNLARVLPTRCTDQIIELLK